MYSSSNHVNFLILKVNLDCYIFLNLEKNTLLFFMPLAGYGFAWFGHFMIEKNKPATFKYPFYSLASDFIMFWHILTFQINDKLKEAHSKIGK